MNVEGQLGELDIIMSNLSEIREDATVPSNVRIKIESVLNSLKDEVELSIKINKTLNDLDELSNDVNLQSYTRTQIWNVISLLEKL